MTRQIFATGMMRSGTSLAQTLLTSHPQLFVAPQPFYQLYVDVKQGFLEEHGLHKLLPLGDGMDSDEAERRLFNRWLQERRFDGTETARLVARAATGKGGGAAELAGRLTAKPGNFFAIRGELHSSLADYFGRQTSAFIGSKDAFCEEYVPALVDAGVRCLLIVRDPRAVIASANHGRFLGEVGYRYPLLMLIRLWRKSAAYWLAYRNHPLVQTVRYEDLILRPDDILSATASWLAVPPFEDGLAHQPLRDHAGGIWKGNSSFGDKVSVDASSMAAWQDLLCLDEIRFIEACTKPELSKLGYSLSTDPGRAAISDFCEDTTSVRESYLAVYRLDPDNRTEELRRWDETETGRYENARGKRLFLFPEVYLSGATPDATS